MMHDKFMTRKVIMLMAILFLAGLLYTMPVYDKYWAPYDEGISLVAAKRIMAGEVPYRDFFVLMYPPGQFYVLALLYSVFGATIQVGRMYTVFLSVGMSIAAFYLTFLITGKRFISTLAWFLVLVSLAPRLGAIPSPIWPGMFLGLFTLCCYAAYLSKPNLIRILYTGFFAGFTMIFRHDIGIFVCLAIFMALSIGRFKRADTAASGSILPFATTAGFVVLPVILYFMSKGATQDMIRSLVLFPLIHEKTAALAFPKPCFDLSMIFHKNLYFITVNQYYVPIVVYALAVMYLANHALKRKPLKREGRLILAVLIFGILAFNQTRVRTDVPHLLTVIQPSVILFGFILHKTHSRWNIKGPGTLFMYIMSTALAILFLFLSIKNVDRYVKNTYRKVIRGHIIRTEFDPGNIYIPLHEREGVRETLEYLKAHTKDGERIYIGNAVHWRDDFGGNTLLYFLADRLPGTKYYELAPGIQTDPEVQKEIANSIMEYRVNTLVLQDIVTGGAKKEDAPKERLMLDEFIERHFEQREKFGKYNIYARRE